MKAQHTPGPWFIADFKDLGFRILAESRRIEWGGYNEIASFDAPCKGRKNTGTLARTDEDTANARLIAAAPALLAACKHAASSQHHPACKCRGEYAGNPEMYCTCHVQKARAAIAAATPDKES